MIKLLFGLLLLGTSAHSVETRVRSRALETADAYLMAELRVAVSTSSAFTMLASTVTGNVQISNLIVSSMTVSSMTVENIFANVLNASSMTVSGSLFVATDWGNQVCIGQENLALCHNTFSQEKLVVTSTDTSNILSMRLAGFNPTIYFSDIPSGVGGTITLDDQTWLLSSFGGSISLQPQLGLPTLYDTNSQGTQFNDPIVMGGSLNQGNIFPSFPGHTGKIGYDASGLLSPFETIAVDSATISSATITNLAAQIVTASSFNAVGTAYLVNGSVVIDGNKNIIANGATFTSSVTFIGEVSAGNFSSSGTINTSTNPVDWTKLKSVPAGFADGVDNSGGGDVGIEEDDMPIVVNLTTVDFQGAQFSVVESPVGEANVSLEVTSVTLQGNSFNGANQLTQLNALGNLVLGTTVQAYTGRFTEVFASSITSQSPLQMQADLFRFIGGNVSINTNISSRKLNLLTSSEDGMLIRSDNPLIEFQALSGGATWFIEASRNVAGDFVILEGTHTRVAMTSGGFIGLGNNTSPSNLVEIKSNAPNNNIFTIERSGGTDQIIQLQETASGNGKIVVNDSGAVNKFIVDADSPPPTGGALCLNASKVLSKCTSVVDVSGNCTCP